MAVNLRLAAPEADAAVQVGQVGQDSLAVAQHFAAGAQLESQVQPWTVGCAAEDAKLVGGEHLQFAREVDVAHLDREHLPVGKALGEALDMRAEHALRALDLARAEAGVGEVRGLSPAHLGAAAGQRRRRKRHGQRERQQRRGGVACDRVHASSWGSTVKPTL